MVAIVGRQRIWSRRNLRAPKCCIHDRIANEYLRFGSHDRFQAFQDLDTVAVRPIVSIAKKSQKCFVKWIREREKLQNTTQPIHVGAFDGILVEKVVGHEYDFSARESVWSLTREYFGLALLDIFRAVLDHKFEARVDG